MAQYSKATDGNGTVRYKDGSRFIKTDDVPQNIKDALAALAEGTVIDELGEIVDISTETDEGSEDEVMPTKAPAEDTSTADEIPAPTPTVSGETVGDTETGEMGFPAKDGKTLSIFSDAPHETIKYIGGLLVPMTHEEYKTKTDGEILIRLQELGKI